MSLINAVNLDKSYGARDIFKSISLSIPRHARIAIIGLNGIGKTTLLRILAGEEEPSGGVISQARNLSIGHLDQEAGLESPNTLWEECLLPFQKLLEQEAELQRLEQAMANPEEVNKVLRKYGRLQAEFDHRGGYTYIHRIQQVLSGLGFSVDEYQAPLTRLSGGERTRALLARLLLLEPDLLILDEPTRGIDVGTKAEIQKLVLMLAEEGKSCMFISSELEEELRTCHRIAVLRDQQKVAEFSDEVDEQTIMQAMAGSG